MALDYERVRGLTETRAVHYDARDTILYALGTGWGRDPRDLPFVYEGAGLQVSPSMASIFGLTRDIGPQCGGDLAAVLHGAQRVRFIAPLPPHGTLSVLSHVSALRDLGPQKGAMMEITTDLSDADGGAIAQLSSVAMLRNDGGFGDRGDVVSLGTPAPDRAPDGVLEASTRFDQALLYRLSGDWNPLHADPEIARLAGFDRPILHGLCSYGIVCRKIVTELCGGDPTRLKALDFRFASPVFPGETLVTDYWWDGDELALRVRVKERDRIVLNYGHAELG